MSKRTIFATLFLLANATLWAQPDSLLLTKNFQFADGVYLSLDALHRNTPDYRWEEIDALLATSARTFVTKVVRLKTRTGQLLDLQSVLAISLEGVPYLRITHDVPAAEPQPETEDNSEEEAVVFAGLKVRGKIAYFSYETDTTEMVEISAYNPLTRRAFRRGNVPVKSSVMVEKIFYFPTGRVSGFTRERLLEWISDDRQMWNTVNELGNRPDREKLFKCLLIYDDRNAFYMKSAAQTSKPGLQKPAKE